MWVPILIVVLVAYLLGSIPSSVWIGKIFYGIDVREHGSGNAGTTNTIRVLGYKAGIPVFIIDALKGWFAVFLTKIVFGYFPSVEMPEYMSLIAAVAVVIGHTFPIFFKFKGGKGVATSLGVVLTLDWQVGVIMAVIAIAIMASSRYVSLGSITAGGLYPFILFVYLLSKGENMESNITYIAMSFILAVILIGKHHSNIKKLRNGTENKLFAKKAQQEEDIEESEEEV